ncbi:MAG: DUF2079 domain-containing protein [Candidatus Izemoplasmatales bacterium]|nr:DUF2079 domain-containing protein [Candidatus Izemoplasmatales bacterium]
MFAKRNLSLSHVATYLIIAFLVMSIIFFLRGGEIRNYYDIRVVTQDELVRQVIVFAGILLGLYVIHPWIKVIKGTLLMGCVWLVFVLLFAITAPAFSLLVGAVIISVPVGYMSLVHLVRKEEHSTAGIDKTINQGCSIINLTLFIVIFLMMLLHIDQVYPVYSGANISQISHADILYGNRKGFLLAGLAVLVGFLAVYFSIGTLKVVRKSAKLQKWLACIAVFVILVAQVVAVSLVMVARTRSLYTPTYDFGIFTQMFYNMKNLNGMVTTLERNMVLSHFAVHVSPIYYVMLPVFLVFPHPETLQVLQIVVVAIGVWPLYLISKEFKLSLWVQTLVLLLYIINPAIIASSFYDLHENCFLAPLLLFVLYFGLKQKTIPLVIFTLLTLMVKEDAGLYLVFVGLYFLFGNDKAAQTPTERYRDVLHALIMIVMAIVYFLVVTSYLDDQGTGAMFWRYDNLNAYRDWGNLGIIASLFQSPSYLLATMFSPEKIYSLIILLATLGFMPLLVKNPANYWLIAPLVIINFATTYPYQHQFGFQYFYGTGALLVFMVLLAAKENHGLKVFERHRSLSRIAHVFALGAVAATLGFGYKFISDRSYNFDIYQQSQEMYEEMRQTLLSIPRDKKIVATGYLTTYLADRYYLYDFEYHNLLHDEEMMDYVIIDMRINEATRLIMQQKCIQAGYVLSDRSTTYLLFYEPPQA